MGVDRQKCNSMCIFVIFFCLYNNAIFIDSMQMVHRYCHLVGPENAILKKGREILLTGCHLRTAVGGFGQPRLLPTEYLVIVLNEVICRALPLLM